MKNVIQTLLDRGFIDAMTSPDLLEYVQKPVKVYCGFDPTADSLHLGNLVGIMGLAWFQKFGHTPVAILGGATGLIGDPSGRSSERNLLDENTLNYNVSRLNAFFQKILPGAEILNNFSWFGSMSLIEFLRDVGKHFRVGPMLAKDSVKSRLSSEEGLSFTEFSYQTLQGYDFYYLNKHHNVTIQLGGSDQWGNITAGIDFNRKLAGNPVFGITFPLITRSDGKKFGKSEEGAIWLSSDRLSPYQLYQYLFKIPDADVIRLLKMLTFLDLSKIYEIQDQMSQPAYVANTAQKILAEEVVRFVHGQAGVDAAVRATQGIGPGSVAALTKENLEALSQDMPTFSVTKNEVVGSKFIDLLVKTSMVPSKGEASRLVKNGGAYLNNERLSDVSYALQETDLIEGAFLVISTGKKNKLIVKIV